MLDGTSRLIAAQPRREVFHLVAVGKNCRQADDTALIGVLTTQEALNLDLVSNFAFAGTDHMAFVEHEQAHIVEQRRIVPQGEIELFGVATTMSRSRMADSSKPDTPMLP